MRLLKLRLKNIASLKGEHTVDFKEIGLHSNLFAITGETGAGKSTILNSVGLALYGDIFKKSLNQIDVVTLGEAEGEIQLLFQVKGKHYLAHWYVRTRKPNGEAYAKSPTPTRTLYEIEGDDFAAPKNVTTVKTEELLNLDFDQFSKCVVLNQGEFAKFLMSTFTDRRAILEKLYPGEMLGNLVKVLKAELDELQEKKAHLEIELKAIQEDGLAQLDLESLLKASERELKLHEDWSELLDRLHGKFTSLSHYHQKNLENNTRMEATRKEIATGTSTYNLLLKAAEESLNAKESAQKTFDQKAPRLQELLRLEESLRNKSTLLETLQRDARQASTEEQELRALILRLIAEEEKLLPQKEKLTSQMIFPPESVGPNREKINRLLDGHEAREKLRKDLSFDQERLQTAEIRGREIATRLQEIQDKLRLIPETLPEELKALTKKKLDAQSAKARLTEIQTQSEALGNQITILTRNSEALEETLKAQQVELQNAAASLKVQELLSAVSVCLLHPQTEERNLCPVCETPFGQGRLIALKEAAGKFDVTSLSSRFEELKAQVVKLETERTLEHRTLLDLTKKRDAFQEEKLGLSSRLIPEEKLDEEIGKLQKLQWDREQLLPLLKTTEAELNKFRQEYREVRAKLAVSEKAHEEMNRSLAVIAGELSAIVPVVSAEALGQLRQDMRLSWELSEVDSKLARITHDRRGAAEQKTKLEEKQKEAAEMLQRLEQDIATLRATLESELKGESAATTLKKLTDQLRLAQEEHDKKERERHRQDGELKIIQSRLNTYEEQSRGYGVEFEKAHNEIKDEARIELPELSEALRELVLTLRSLALTLASPASLLIPLSEVLEKEKSLLRTRTNEARSRLAQLQSKKDDQEKKRDRIQLLELKRADVQKELNRRGRLNEILGKDELRTYVLSLVEENLIIITNEELSRLCQNRYEIIHQTRTTKLAPEFFILDKFRDGGIRKVSTLSGGETFMVSLAMALGLAELTRGSAEIDTLFIDEGFGTLDQDSLEDVVDMLNQIQNRGLMVGIISHVKALTSALPVNLQVSKRQDGTSSVGLRLN